MDIVEAGGVFENVLESNRVCVGPFIFNAHFRNNVLQNCVQAKNITFFNTSEAREVIVLEIEPRRNGVPSVTG